MKKLSVVILTAVLLLAGPSLRLASAGDIITQDSGEKSGNITVGYDAGVAYTVTIPASVTFTDSEKRIERPLQVNDIVLNEGSTLSVNIASANHFKMTHGEGYIEYSLLVNSNAVPKENSFNVLKVAAGDKSGWAILEFVTDLNTEYATYAGSYTDTLTFTVTIN